MTYTFKLSRRLAQLKAGVVVAGHLLITSCTGSETAGPSQTDPLSVVIAPDSSWVAVDETVQFQTLTDISGALSFKQGRQPKVVSLAVSPASARLADRDLQRFTATATLSDGSTGTPAVTWTATGGTVDATGKYTAGKTPGTYRVIATTRNNVADTAVVTIVAIAQVIVTPATVELHTGVAQQFSATGKMTDSSTAAVTVAWSATGGTISPAGLYTAGQAAGSYLAIAVLAGGTLADTSPIVIAAPTSPAPPPPPTSPPPGVPILPGQSIQAAVTANGVGTTFLIKAGRHVRQNVVPKNGNTFRCEPGAILDGESVTPYAFRRSGSDPDDVRIVGCLIERYAPPPQMGAILAGGHTADEGTSGWIVDSTEVRNNSNLGIRLGHRMKVRWSFIHHNGTLGIGGIGDDILIEGNEIAHMNPNHEGDLDFETGGTKFVLTNRLIVRNNFVHHNYGEGLWTDIDNLDYIYEQNICEDNWRAGIHTELSGAGIIRNNLLRRNGLQDTRGWIWGGGIQIAASKNVEVYGNTLEGNKHGITLIQQNRGSGTIGPYIVENVYVHSNMITQPSGMTGVVQDIGDNAIFASRNNRFANNKYVITGNARPFAWMNGGRTETEWKAYGQDQAGSFIR